MCQLFKALGLTLSLVFVLASCGPTTPAPSGTAAKAPTTVPPGPASATTAKPVAPAAPKAPTASTAQQPSVMVNDGAGALNGDLENWVEGAPLYWTIIGAGAGKSGVAPEQVDVKSGKTALKANPGMYSWICLMQPLRVEGSIAGKTLKLSGEVKTNEANAKAMLFFGQNEVATAVSDPHPGDGQWHKLQATYKVPDEGLPKGFFIGFGNGGATSPTQPCWFDDIRLTVE